ncbi:MAG TPA: Wzz/FepE/Etk N-terminal domain-containing protein [Anaerolineae bacterium]|nr:Wzz/FepE/Etk N-terminal domain-containing protein [Anaerolineae bacterium]
MEEEIDLRAYVAVLIRYWKWIAGLALVAAVAAFVVSLLLPSAYEASAVVIITEPRYQMQFDPRFKTADQWTPAYNAFPTLATSDGVLRSVLDAYAPSPEAGIEEWKLRTLSGMVEATSEGDPSLVVLRARSRSPEDAAAIANLWADALVKRGNDIYSDREDDVEFFQEQVAQAGQALDDADAALVEFEARSQASTVDAQLESLRQAQADYLADQRAIAYIVQDIQGLRAQLVQQPGDRPVSLADDLTALLLQIKAFNLLQVEALDAQASTSIQLQISSGGSFSDKSPAEQVAFLDDLVDTLEAKSSKIDGRLAELEPQMLALQRRLQEIAAESDRLTSARDLTSETYKTLARKLEEARIAAREENGVLQVGSYAAVPEKPMSPRKLLNTAVAGTLGLMLGVFGAFALEWWRTDEEREDRESGEGAL